MRIQELRKRFNVQQKELAGELGISPNTLSQYETGKREPNIEILQKISDYFNVTTDYLIGRKDHTVCSVCYNSYDPLNEYDSREHEEFHKKFVAAQEKYGRIPLYMESYQKRSDSIRIVRNPQLSTEERAKGFDDYLKYSFICDIWDKHFNLSKIDREAFIEKEVSSFHSDELIPEELCSMVHKKYNVSEHPKVTELNSRDRRDIAKDVDSIMEKLSNKEYGPAAYKGEDLSEESMDLFKEELEIALKRLKLINKEKYNPNKNKK